MRKIVLTEWKIAGVYVWWETVEYIPQIDSKWVTIFVPYKDWTQWEIYMSVLSNGIYSTKILDFVVKDFILCELTTNAIPANN